MCDRKLDFIALVVIQHSTNIVINHYITTFSICVFDHKIYKISVAYLGFLGGGCSERENGYKTTSN